MEPHRVELRAARIPFIGTVAHHHWLVVDRDGIRSRWEVWHRANAGGESWDHLHRNLLRPADGVGSGPSWALASWAGDEAVALIERIESSPTTYPWRGRYRYWPGPNSNTYVQWILGSRFRLGRCGVGKHYCPTLR